MKIAKKSLSIFLAFLMLFSACSVGLTGITAFAAEGDESKYTQQEVADLINAATAGGLTLTSSNDKFTYAEDDGKVLAAAEAIFDYAVNLYRGGNDATAEANSTTGLYNRFDAEFSSMYTNAAAARQLVKSVLNPDGTTVYDYKSPAKKTGIKGAETTDSISAGADVSDKYPLASYGSYYAVTNTDTVTKTSVIQIDMEKYLLTFDKIEDIPTTVYTGVTYTYGHTYKTSAKVTSVSSDTRTEGSGCDAKDVTYYTPTMETSYWNFMTGKPTRKIVKDNTVRKTLLTLEKYFNEDLLSITRNDMLAMSVEDIKSLYLTTESMYKSLFTDETLTERKFSDAVLTKFGFSTVRIHQFMDEVDFAYRAVAAKYNIDNLNTLIGTEYNVESYAEMSALYAKTNTAYNVVFSLDDEIIAYLQGEGNYSEQYASALALKSAAESYNATLFDIMTEQKLEETVAAMVKTYGDYINVLNKEDIENPSDAEVIGLVQKVEAFDAIIASYTTKSYYRNYWTAEYESEWARFSAILDEVYEVRGLKMEFETYYDYFLPLIYTTQIDTLDNDAAISLHKDLDTKISELRKSYNSVVSKWGGTIADKIFTTVYEGSPYLLQTLVDSVKSAGKEAVKTVLIARTEAQLDAVYAYKDTTTVNFDNFASIKSTLTYFDYDLYNYVAGQSGWLTSEYTNKYSMVQTLLDRYHAFSTSDGKSFFNESFTFADANGNYAVRYAGNQLDADGNQIGYPNDIARDGADDNYVVTEQKLLDTVTKIDGFISSRDFGAIVGLVDTETEEYCDIGTYVSNMLTDMLYNDAMMNTLVGAIFPMLCEMIQAELVGALGTMDGARLDDNGVPWLDLSKLVTDVSVTGELALFLDKARVPNNPEHDQKPFMDVFHDIGLNIYPATLAKSLMMSNAVAYGIGTPIYEALMAAGDDWTKLVCADDPETTLVDETKALDFEWGVYDEDTFIETMGCILDAILPLLQAVLTDKRFEGTSANALIAYTDKITAIYIINATNTYIRGELTIGIDPLNAWSTLITPLFEVLGVEKIPTVKADSTGYDIADALIGTLLKRVDQILKAPLSSILDILPNLVYFLSMDTVQEMINTLNIQIKLNLTDMDLYKGDGMGAKLLDWLKGTVMDLIAFDVPLEIADLLDLYDLLGFEISDFNEILKFATASMGLNLPPIKQQEIIFCSDWGTSPTGRVYLNANEGDLMYWFLNYAVSALIPDENGNSLLTSLLGEDMDPMVATIIDNVIYEFTSNPRGALAALIELLNPAEYDLTEMTWVESQFDYNEIAGANQMSIVYLNYGNNWNRESSEYILNNVDEIINAVMGMTGSDELNLGATIKGMVDGLFTNANITALVEMLGGLGDSPSAIIADIVGEQVGIKLDTWFTAFGYLFPAETWAEDAEIIPLGHRNYVNDFGVEGVANEDGTITWYFNKMELRDGDGYTFVNILTRLLGGADVLVEFLFAGGDVSAFDGLLTLKGYETYATSLGLIFEMLGVQNLPTQEAFNNDAMGSLANMLFAVLDWFYALVESEDMIAQVVELIPNLFYFVESNGLSTVLRNLLQPVWVLVDTIRPLVDVDLNGVLSLVVSDFLNYGAIDVNTIIDYVFNGIYVNDDLDYVWYNVDLFNLTFTEIIKLADLYLGTNLYESGLVQIGIKGFCSGLEEVDSAVGTIYRPTINAADTVTILVTAILDCLSYPANDPSMANGDAIFALLAELTGMEELAGAYPAIAEILAGIDYEYADLNWAYMFNEGDIFTPGELPEQSIVYLGYTTDWDQDTAKSVYNSLDDILDLVLPSLLEDNEDLAGLVNGLLNDSVYTDANLNTIVELLVNLIAALDSTLIELVDAVLTTDISAWFDMCEPDENGKFVCTVEWGVDAAAEADKKDIFVDGIKEVLEPANAVLSWLFFGTEYAFFTASDASHLITLNGGEGYAYGLVPLLEALGCTVPAAETFYDAATDTYNVGDAVEAILNGVLALADKITADPVKEVFNLLPNLIYFINADGAKVVVNNLIAPVNAILEKVSAFTGEISLGGLLVDAIGFDITAIDMNTIGTLVADAGVIIPADVADILSSLYVGQLTEFTSANGRTAYRLNVEGYEGDILTIVLSLAIDLFKLNDKLFGDLLGAENYASIITLLGGLDFEKNYLDMNWAYMYDGDLDKLMNAGFPEQTIEYLGYKTDWDEETAAAVYGALDDILDLVLPSLLEDNDDLAALVDGLLNDNVYTDQNLNTIVEGLVGLLVGLDEALYNGVGALLDADIKAWFDMCDITTDADGKTVVECTKDWGVDAASDKKAAFVAGIKEVLNPANKLLSWLFFGEKFTLFNGTTSEVLITLNGGHGYAYGLAPIFEALGCEMKPASAFLNADGTYNVGNAVESILDSTLALVDEISANPVDEVFALLPNLLYFINAGGLKAAVNNLLAPVNAVLDCLGGLTGNISIGGLLEDAIGLDICDITMDTVLTFAADYGFTVNEEMAYVLKNLFVGTPVAYTSASGRTAYHVEYNNGNPAHEMLTILLSFAVEAFTINETLFADLLGEDIYWAVRNLIKGVADEFEYLDLNWAYMYEGATNAEKLAALKAANGVLPERTNAAYDVYTLYQNNWNEATADYVTLVLDKLVHEITTAVRSDGSSLGQILDKAIADGLYQDSLLNDLVGLVVNLLVDYEEIIKGAGALLGAESLVDWFTYCEEDEETGKLVCTKDWGIDKAETIDEKRTAFINAFATVLEPAYDLLAWLFFAEDYTFFSATTGAPLITLTGGKGYEEAFVPLFEAVGVLMKRDANGELLSVEDTYLNGESAVLPASYFYTAAGELDMKLAVTTIFSAVSDWLYDICGDLADQSGDGALTSMLERLPNLLYSVNADGLVAVVNNLTAPVMHLLDNLGAFGLELDFNEMIGIEGMDLFNFQFDDLFALLADEDVLGLYFPDYTQEFLKTFYIGELKSYRSANGSEAYFMTYTEEESAAEMITCLIGFVVDAFQDPRNKACLVDWFNGEDIYNAIMAVLGLNGVKEMQEFNWMYTEYADTDHTFNATESSVKYSVAYNTIWTRDKAQYISQNLIPFVNNILGLIGLELNGYEIKNVDNLIDSLLNGKLYTVETVDMLLELIRDLVGNLTSLEPYGEYIINVLDKAFGVNLAAWDTMSFSFADGDKDAFVAALGEIIAPIVPLLDVLLCGENIELFYSIAPEKVGDSALIIYGSEGYAYGIVPLFEALGCEMMTPDTFKKLSNKDKAASLINSLLNRIDVIAADPVTEIFKMIPELVYFINSNGLDTAVDNILNSVDTVLIALEPLLGATSLMELLGVDLAEFNMDYLIELACDAISESTGLDCEPLLVDFVAELTMGKVISYTSANGETYYKMVFANEDQMTDMVTVILRLAIDFLATGENADAIIALIANNSESEEAANSASTLINFILTAANTEPVTSGAMATLYYIFFGLNNGVTGIDTLYGNYGKTWDSLVGFFQESDDSYYTKAAEVLKNLLAEIGGVDTGSSVPVCDCDCHNNSSFIRFFHKIITFLRKLFGMKEFQYCDCGTAHW